MEGGPPFGSRARRAIPVIAAALTVVLVTGVLYLRAGAKPQALAPAATAPSPPLLPPGYTATYEFVTPALGWALVGEYGVQRYWVFRTADGARHWTRQWSGSAHAVGREGVQLVFFDRTHGFFSLSDQFVYKTEDGGTRWTSLALPPFGFLSLDFADWQHEWYLGTQIGAGVTVHFFRSAVGGTSWSELPSPPQPDGIAFRNATEGWDGSTGLTPDVIYSSHDGGSSWQERALPIASLDAKASGWQTTMRLLPGAGLLAMLGDKAFTSFDGARSWRQVAPLPVTDGYGDVVFQDARHWWVMRSGDLFISSDAGQSWRHVGLQLDDWEYTIGVIDSRHAWARLDYSVGQTRAAGTGLALTSDGGVHWSYAAVPNPA